MNDVDVETLLRIFTAMQKKQQLLAAKMKGEQGLPFALAMIIRGVHDLTRLGEPVGVIRNIVESALAMYAGATVERPTDEEVIAIAAKHNKKVAERYLCEHGNIRASCNIGACRTSGLR